ncbi:hypothetical protein, partial [Klebsiella pneumoniae]|uniref:hypothetical protein n=1 Tax=Klebsiella pneumoniae TaxID=573 RepID=UPI001969232C
GLDACEEIQVEELEILEDEKLLELFKTKVELLNLKQFYKESKSFLKLFLIAVIITCTAGLKFLS